MTSRADSKIQQQIHLTSLTLLHFTSQTKDLEEEMKFVKWDVTELARIKKN